MSRVIEFNVPHEYEGKKFVSFLRGYVRMSYSQVSSLKRVDGAFLRNGELVRTIDRLSEGDSVTVTVPDGECTVEPADIPIDVLYEDEDILVINKSPDIAMHPSHGHQTDTLANGAAMYLKKRGHSGAFRAVGRLDKGTSGVVICALNTYAASRLSGNVKKTYLAVCEGLTEESGTVDEPIYRPYPDKTLRACGKQGERAVTHYRLLESVNEMSLIELSLETGKTHQIRVHMAHIGHPLIGDALYGNSDGKYSHHMLHCVSAVIIHPVSNERMEFTAPPPEDFKNVILKIRR